MPLIWSVISIALAGSIFWSWLVLIKRKTNFARPEIVMGAAVITLAQIIAVSMLAGWLNLFQWEIVYTINLLITLVLFVYNKKNLRQLGKIADIRSLAGQLSWLTKVVVVLAIVVISWQVALGTVLNDVSFDSLNYHLAWSASAVQEQNLGIFSTPVPWINVYPKNIDIWYAWFLLPPAHDWLVDLAQLPFALLAVVAIYSIARKLRYSRDTSVLAASLFLFLPVVFHQSLTNYNDLALAALLLVALNFVLEDSHAYWVAIIFGLTAGIMVGSKVVMIIPFFILLAILLYRLLKVFKLHAKHLIRLSGIAIVLMFLLSFYWYARNYFFYESFIYPVKVMLGSFTLIGGLIDIGRLIGDNQPELLKNAGLIKNVLVNSYYEAVPRYDMTPGSFGPLWAFLLLPAMVPAVMLWFSQRKWKVLGVFALIILFFVLTPGNWWWRYAIVLSAAGMLALAEIYEWSRKFKFSQAVLGGFILLLSFWSIAISWWPAYTDSSVYANKFINNASSRDFSHRYKIFESIDEAQTPDSTIAYDSSWFVVYPLWNSTRSNRVIHVPYNVDWLQRLESEGVDYLAAKFDSPEFGFIQANEERFELLAGEGIYYLYKLVR